MPRRRDATGMPCRRRQREVAARVPHTRLPRVDARCFTRLQMMRYAIAHACAILILYDV